MTSRPGRRGERAAGDRLAVVLRLRRIDEDRARLALARALALEAAARKGLAEAEADHEAACAAARSLLGGPLVAATLAGATAGLEVVERRRAAAADELERARRSLAEARTMLAAATRRREAVERLRARRLVEARRFAERLAERELAEIALVRWARALAEAHG